MRRCRMLIVAGALIHFVLGTPAGAAGQQSPATYMASGDKKFQAHDLTGAIDDYTKAIALDPANAWAFTARGFIRIQAEQMEAALADFTHAILLNPKDAANFGYRSYLKNYKGDLDGAISDARQTALLDPRALLAYKTLAEAHFFKSYRCSELTPSQKRENVSLGLDAADRALQIDAEDYSTLVYKNILLRSQANLESDEAKRKSLLAQADEVRAKSQQVRSSPAVSPLPPIPPDRPITCLAGAAPVSRLPPAPTMPEPTPIPGLDSTTPRRPLPPGAVRAGDDVPTPKKIKDVLPVYPPIAVSARVQGLVIVELTIGRDGKVIDAFILKSIPLLDQAALDAVRQWEFEPPSVKGMSVPVVATFTVTFRLQSP